MLDVHLKDPVDHLADIAQRAKARRLHLNLTQLELAQRSGVSLGSIRRFESTGLIALSSLLNIALVLDGLRDFEGLFPHLPQGNLFAPKPKKRHRGSGRRKT